MTGNFVDRKKRIFNNGENLFLTINSCLNEVNIIGVDGYLVSLRRLNMDERRLRKHESSFSIDGYLVSLRRLNMDERRLIKHESSFSIDGYLVSLRRLNMDERLFVKFLNILRIYSTITDHIFFYFYFYI